jgi:hypothetical protein
LAVILLVIAVAGCGGGTGIQTDLGAASGATTVTAARAPLSPVQSSRTLALPAGSLDGVALINAARMRSTEYLRSATSPQVVVGVLMTTTAAADKRAGGSLAAGAPDLPALMVTLSGDYSISAPGSTVFFRYRYAIMNVKPETGETVSLALANTVDLAGMTRPPP